MSDIAIKITNLSKTFFVHENPHYSLKGLFSSFFRQGRTKQFKVLDDINLEINKGDFVGIIGRNGTGKSTLLKLIAGIYASDRGGKIKVNGHLVPFLELGVGFNPELTGRENIYLNGTILGMTKKFLDRKYQDIVDFAELHDFMEMPVKNYSSGMMVRLAFSIAIQADAEIYILDEILAVGDAAFQQKSAGIIRQFIKEGKTVLFVSHSGQTIVNYCNRVIWINEGKVAFDGDPQTGVDKYTTSIQNT